MDVMPAAPTATPAPQPQGPAPLVPEGGAFAQVLARATQSAIAPQQEIPPAEATEAAAPAPPDALEIPPDVAPMPTTDPPALTVADAAAAMALAAPATTQPPQATEDARPPPASRQPGATVAKPAEPAALPAAEMAGAPQPPPAPPALPRRAAEHKAERVPDRGAATGPGTAAPAAESAQILPAAAQPDATALFAALPVQQAGEPQPRRPATIEPAAAPPHAVHALEPATTTPAEGTAATPPPATTRPAPPATPMRQVQPLVVAIATAGGTARLSVTLEPAELGRVEISVERSGDAAQVTILAERPETLALLQRDQREIDRALSDAGLGSNARSLAFGLAQDGAGGHRHGGNPRDGARTARGGAPAGAEATPGATQATRRERLSLLDLAV